VVSPGPMAAVQHTKGAGEQDRRARIRIRDLMTSLLRLMLPLVLGMKVRALFCAHKHGRKNWRSWSKGRN
jgi:hypothetical protein